MLDITAVRPKGVVTHPVTLSSVRFSAMVATDTMPRPEPRRRVETPRPSGLRRFITFMTAALGITYASHSFDKVPSIGASVTQYGPSDKRLVQYEGPVFSPPWLAKTNEYELREQSFNVDVEGMSKDGKRVRMQMQFPMFWDMERLDEVDKYLGKIPQTEKDDLYLNNWGKGGTDRNAVIYFGKVLHNSVRWAGQKYIETHNADELKPENAYKINEAIRKGHGDIPGLEDHLEKNLKLPIRVGEVIHILF
jgi:hypothetical protein